MGTISWIMDADAALEFYTRKAKSGATTEEECNQILFQMSKEGLIQSVMATERSKDQVIEDLGKNWGKVLHIKGNDETSTSKE